MRVQVEWQDLVALSPWEVVHELVLPLPWLLGSLWLAGHGQGLWALPCSFMFFLCGLRVVHNAYHYAVGLPRKATEAVIFAFSALMLGSMHAVQFNHLRHHAYCLEERDVEAMSAHMAGWRALALGPLFPVLLHLTAWREGSAALKRWVAAELLLTAALMGLGYAGLGGAALAYHVAVMGVGQCCTAFFAVWTVHHGCDGHEVVARTQRGWWRNFVSYGMFRHVEHHMYPRVPTCHLGALAERLDRVAPELAARQVF